MAGVKTAPYGAWRSPVSAATITVGAVNLSQIVLDGSEVYWTEMRPSEGGRSVLVRRSPGGITVDITPLPYNVRTRVHEYGEGAYLVNNGTVYFSNFVDQRLYCLVPGSAPVSLTFPVDMRYADGAIDTRRNRIYLVREDHTGAGEAVNTLVSLDLASTALQSGRVEVSGSDFYSNPRLSADGKTICWLSWNHPNMPWDGTELWVADLDEDGSPVHRRLVAGGKAESIFQPEWSPDGTLFYISDRSGWWNLYRNRGEHAEAIYPLQAEFGAPQWVFAMSTYAFLSPDELVCIYSRDGQDTLVLFDLRTSRGEPIETGYTRLDGLHAREGTAYLVAGSSCKPWSLISIDLKSRQIVSLRVSRASLIMPDYIPDPQMIQFPTENGLSAYGFYYPPTNPEFSALPGEKPPLLVMSHGGPTGCTSTVYQPRIYYYTSRGIAVLDVDYGGSSGYGREYRQRLNGQWGIMDVDDCINGARYLVQRGLVDENRLTITGGSAGGYTTLCALTFRDVFKAGSSHYGIGDLEVFIHDTHKFESHYMDTLIGPYPERKDLYHDRSPINYTDRLSCAMILFQGLDDKIVPPNQAELMFQAVLKKNLPVAYLAFEGEQHGFRKAENIKRVLEADLFFLSRIFGFDLADPVEPVDIKNL